MEHSRFEINLQRVMALCLGIALAAVAVAERHSPLARARAEGRTWAAWLALASGPDKDTPSLHLVLYHPSTRRLELIYVPDSTKSLAGKPIVAAYDAALAHGKTAQAATEALALAASELLPATTGLDWGRLPLIYEKAPLAGSEEAAGRAKEWLTRKLASPASWFKARDVERLILQLELSRLKSEDILPAWLPEEGHRAAFLARLMETAPQEAVERSVTVEVFNCTGQAGLATQAKKVLRLRGADVVATGNSDVLETRTIVYDRTGRHADAQAVRKMLGCGSALAVTQIDPKRLVDVSVLLADDCPLQ